jgi:tRNA pseudouridine55 synthase
MAKKRKGRPIDGVVLINKPQGLSSNHVLQRVKRIYQAAKAGHTGALDPLATGLLPICLGEATKFSQLLLESDKTYQTVAKLGERTDSFDADGEVTERRSVPELSREQIERQITEHLLGEIQQTAPIYSALKVDGKPMYELARAGKAVEPKTRQVTIFRCDLLELHPDQLKLEVQCSKGTYIRSLVDDLGQLLNCGAHVAELHRTGHGPYHIDRALTLEQLEQLAEQGFDALDQRLLPIDSSVPDWPRADINEMDSQRFNHGNPCPLPDQLLSLNPESTRIRVYGESPSRLLGIGRINSQGELAPDRLIVCHS